MPGSEGLFLGIDREALTIYHQQFSRPGKDLLVPWTDRLHLQLFVPRRVKAATFLAQFWNSGAAALGSLFPLAGAAMINANRLV